MAQNQLGNIGGFVDKRAVSKGGSNADSISAANYADETSLDTRLNAVNGSYYTTARLDQMSINDKVYALRLADDSGSV